MGTRRGEDFVKSDRTNQSDEKLITWFHKIHETKFMKHNTLVTRPPRSEKSDVLSYRTLFNI